MPIYRSSPRFNKIKIKRIADRRGEGEGGEGGDIDGNEGEGGEEEGFTSERGLSKDLGRRKG